MSAPRATWLTWRMHRFEVVFVAGVAVLLAATLWVIASHLRDIHVDPGCWAQWDGSDQATSACQRTVGAWLDVNEHEVGQTTGLLVFLPILLGAILGVPVVGREAEARTLSLAWALEGRRWRWLVARVLPMLAVAVVAAVLLGLAASEMRAAQAVSPFEAEDLGDIARQGPVLASRVLLGFGAGLFAGAILGRTLPALLVASALVVGWVGFAGPMVEREVARTQAVWVPSSQVFADGNVQALAYLDGATRGPDGTIVQEDESVTVVCSSDDTECQDDDGNQYVALVVPFEAEPAIERFDVAVTLGLAVAAVGGTLLVVSRHRPE
ncbi:MAG: hypothetical protein U0667_05590 [Chloroflexota bacterium]